MLTFANPVFLWGLLGLAAPVLIHLIHRDLFRPVRFPSIRFILRGKMPMRRRRKPTDLWLLLLRMALFTALVLALAKPEWKAGGEPLPELAGGEEELVLLIDLSASMGGWSGLEEARREALRLLDGFSGSPVGLVLSARGPEQVLPLHREHGEMRRILTGMEALPVAGNHRESLSRAAGLFTGERPRTLAIVSDFQESDWSPSLLPALDPEIQVRWIPVGLAGESGRNPNVAVLQARRVPAGEDHVRVYAEVRNFSPEPVERSIVFRAGESVARDSLLLPPEETVTAVLTLARPAGARGMVRLEGEDAYAGDNEYHVWLGSPPPVRVLALADPDREPGTAEELFFVQRALESRGSERIRFPLSQRIPGNWDTSLLASQAAVLLLGSAPYLNAGEWEALDQFLREGGMILMTPGMAPARQFALLRENGWLRASFAGMAQPPGLNRLPPSIEWINPASPLADVFRDGAAAALFHVNLNRFVRLGDFEETTVLLRADEQSPVLLEADVGQGRFVLSTVAFQTSWTDLPISTAFLPLLRELTAGRLPPHHGVIELETGFSPRALPETAASQLAGTGEPDPLVPGIRLLGETPMVVNVPRSESIPATVSTVDLQAAIRHGRAGTSGMEPPAPGKESTPLWHWPALAALLFFLLETPVAAMATAIQRRAARPAASA